jgi:hypothetical protein
MVSSTMKYTLSDMSSTWDILPCTRQRILEKYLKVAFLNLSLTNQARAADYIKKKKGP